MQKWKISHFQKWRGRFYDSRNKQKKFGSYYIHLNIDTHTPKKLEVALKREKKVRNFVFNQKGYFFG